MVQIRTKNGHSSKLETITPLVIREPLLRDKVALITGAAGKMGRAIALELVREGATVVLNDIPAKQALLEGFAFEISRAVFIEGQSVFAATADVTDSVAVANAIEEIKIRTGKGVDILVNNAGVTRDKKILGLTEENWDLVLSVNLKSAYLCSKAVLPWMREKGWGRIINISSFVGLAGNVGQTNYAASKAGLIGFTKSLAEEVQEKGILVNAVAPGFCDTDMVANIPTADLEAVKASIPMKRLGRPEEVAQVVWFLAAYGTYMSGSTIDVNGGIYIR